MRMNAWAALAPGQQLLMPDPAAPPTFDLAVDDRLNASGWDLLGRWERALSVTSDVSLQLYYDHTERDEYYRYVR